MSPQSTRTPSDPGPGPGGFYDVARLAQRLGIATATLRQHVAAQVPWLPRPEKLSGRLVWPASALEGVEARKAEWPAHRPRKAKPVDGTAS